MPAGRVIAFGAFRLDRVDGRLWEGDVERPLRAKSIALLRHLAEHPRRLVTRDELLRAVWPGIAVSGSVVRTSICEVREALGDDPLSPRFIETIGRRGYRFLGGPAAEPASDAFVGREGELARLHRHLERCRSRCREVLFVSGEPGIGKTTLVERFVDEVGAAKLGRTGMGQCVELHGPAEAYLPVLDLLARLCRDDDGGRVVRALERWAPTWLLQLPGFVGEAETENLRRRVPSPNRDRMLRELSDVFDVLGRDAPLVVVLEDLHWSDVSTIDLLTYVAERGTPTQLLVIGTFRPVELVLRQHPLRAVAQQLIARGRAAEIALELLPADGVRAYLHRRLGAQPMDPRLPALVHARTEGNPLFLVTVVDHLLDTGALAFRDATWHLTAAPDDAVPQSLHQLVVGQLEALGPMERTALAAASVMGLEFDAVAVAAATHQRVEDVELLCARLAERGQLVCTTGTTVWPDGSFGGTYEFLHAVHEQVLYERLPPAERMRLHRAIGERLENGHAGAVGTIAAVLASHFERGSEWARAVRHHVAAVEVAKTRLADREVVAHCEGVLGLLPRLPVASEREPLEMACSLDLGMSLLAARGYGAPEVEAPLLRARDLALRLEAPQVEFIARGGLFAYHVMRGDQRRAVELAGDLLAMANRFPIPLFVVIGRTTLGCAHYNLGNVVVALEHFEQARAAWEPGFPRVQLDQKVLFLGVGALVLQQLGDTPAADEWSDAAVAYASGLEDPLNVAHAYNLAAQYRAVAGHRPGAMAWADRAIAVAAEHGFRVHEAASKTTKGWALGDLALQREGFAACTATGQRVSEPMYRAGIVSTLLDQERVAEAKDELALAFGFVDGSGEARHLAELHRLRAACARREGSSEEADADLRRAIEVATAQGSRLFVLRAAADLAEQLARAGRAKEARAILAPLSRGFVPEGQGAELARVRALQASLG